jgi:hypothetical protein
VLLEAHGRDDRPMNIKNSPSQPQPLPWLGVLGVLIALSAPLAQGLLIPWFKSTFEFPMDRFVSLWIFWIAMILALGIAHFGEGYPLAAFGFQRSKKTLRARLIEWILTVLGAAVIASVPFVAPSRTLYVTNQPGSNRKDILSETRTPVVR